MTALIATLLALLATGGSWIDPHATAREAARLYAEGKFAEASAKYREALVDDPDSALLHYNAAAASHRDGKFEDALAALAAIPVSDADPLRAARVSYNRGNTSYRLGAAAEATDPTQALERYAEALAAYRRAMGADPADEDAKFNHELVERRMNELRKKLEEEQQQEQQQHQPDEPPEQQDQQDGSQQAEKRQPEPQGEQPDSERPDDAQGGQAEQPQPQNGDQHAGRDGGTPADERPRPSPEPRASGGEPVPQRMSPREAEALLDGQRDQEVQPEEIVRRLGGAAMGEPLEDW